MYVECGCGDIGVEDVFCNASCSVAIDSRRIRAYKCVRKCSVVSVPKLEMSETFSRQRSIRGWEEAWVRVAGVMCA